ncbi:DUF3467 domain-containing protein [Hydrogenivirga sp. 128-5-R1-1]|uniref:DUF3467 domain-containing protein n=1 Tax=Hydrogenivirga sp. 128-5-R1-1 TaxID=392423 RepID=UPI00015F1702|nr:DUF3467 domain-containing protein [Hydrogenivirga sp. 128-5-R1-1]EDP76215.1 hypothetical protein HG1285_18634 [Hydrogenivirga sp. 128-5-R1-1]
MKSPFQELHRFMNWKERFLRDYEKIESSDLELIRGEVRELLGQEPDERLLKAVRSMYVGGMERRVEDPEIRSWTNWAAVKTYKTFNEFPILSDLELAFVFYSVGKLFVPLLMHERGVKSESFKRLSREEQEEAVFEELDTIWETQLTLILQALQFLGLNSIKK